MFRAWFYTIRQEIVCVCKKLYNKTTKKKSLLIALLTSCLLIVLIMLSWYFGLCLLSSFLHVISFRFFFIYVFLFYSRYSFYTSGCYSYIYKKIKEFSSFSSWKLYCKVKVHKSYKHFFFVLLTTNRDICYKAEITCFEKLMTWL